MSFFTKNNHDQNDHSSTNTTLIMSDSNPKPTLTAPKTAITKHWAKQYRTEIAASTSSVCSTFISYPLDTVKTRMQTYGFTNFSDCVRDSHRTDGVRGFYRGLLAPLCSITFVRTISFSVYQKAKYKYSAAIGEATGMEEPLVTVNKPGSVPSFATVACFTAAGATAGSVQATLACPFELTKTAAQISGLMAQADVGGKDDSVRKSYDKKGTVKMFKTIIQHRGFVGLYSGYHLCLLRDTVGTAAYFGCYETTKQLLVKYSGRKSPTSPLAVVTAGGFCGLVTILCTFPMDSVRAQYQRNCLEKGNGEAASRPKINYFDRMVWKGLGVTMTRSCILNAIFFSSFELVKKQINALDDPLASTSSS